MWTFTDVLRVDPFPDEFQQQWRRLTSSFEYSIDLIVMAVLAAIWSETKNRRVDDLEASARWAAETENQFGSILRESMERKKLIEVSLTNRKSYVGLVTAEDPEGGWEHAVTLLPLLSGYRHQNTRRLIITNNYAAAAQRSATSLADLSVVIAMKEVVSICHFDPEIRNALQTQSGGPVKIG